jgi:hypothetical protein
MEEKQEDSTDKVENACNTAVLHWCDDAGGRVVGPLGAATANPGAPSQWKNDLKNKSVGIH